MTTIPITELRKRLRDTLQAVVDWDAKANPPNDTDDKGSDYLNEDGWAAFVSIAANCREALSLLDSLSRQSSPVEREDDAIALLREIWERAATFADEYGSGESRGIATAIRALSLDPLDKGE